MKSIIKKRFMLLAIVLIVLCSYGCGSKEDSKKQEKPIVIKNEGELDWSKENFFKAVVDDNNKTKECVVITSPVDNKKSKTKVFSCFDKKLNGASLGTIIIEKPKVFIYKKNERYKIQELFQLRDDIVELKNKKANNEVYCYYSVSKKQFSDKYMNVIARYDNRIAYPDDAWGNDEITIEDLFVDKPFKKSFVSASQMAINTYNGVYKDKKFQNKNILMISYNSEETGVDKENIDVNDYSDEELMEIALEQYKKDYGNNHNINPIVDGVNRNIVSMRMYLKGTINSTSVGMYNIDRTNGHAEQDPEF